MDRTIEKLSKWGQIAALGLIALVATVVGSGGCSDDPPQVEPEVTNVTDNFYLRIEDAQNVDTLLTYWWPIQGSTANIDQNADIKQGNVAVVIRDATQPASSPPLYETDLSQNGSFTTQSGAAGSWRITFDLNGFSGLIEFRAQRK